MSSFTTVCKIFPNIDLLRNKDYRQIYTNQNVLEIKSIHFKQPRRKSQSGNIIPSHNITIPIDKIVNNTKLNKEIMGIQEQNKHINIVKFFTSYQNNQNNQNNSELIWIPFNSVSWPTDAEDINKLLNWAKSDARMAGVAGLGPDITGCTAQALLACQHNFNLEPKLVAPSPFSNYAGIQSGFASGGSVGNKGTMDFALSPQVLLNYLSTDNSEFEYIGLDTEYLHNHQPFSLWSQQEPVATGIVLFKKFMLLLKNNKLILKDTKFVLNNSWEEHILDAKTNNTIVNQNGHSQLIAYYLEDKNHCLKVIDTQIACDKKGSSALMAEGIGKTFESALDMCCKMAGHLGSSRSYGIICRVPKKLLDGNLLNNFCPNSSQHYSQLSNFLLNISLMVCSKATDAMSAMKECAVHQQQQNADSYSQSRRLVLSYTSVGGPQLIISKFDQSLAYNDARDVVNNQLKTSKSDNNALIWVQVMNMQKACFPSVSTNGSFNVTNPLLQNTDIWHCLTTMKKNQKVALASLRTLAAKTSSSDSMAIIEAYNEGMVNIFTVNGTVPILEIYSVCTNPYYKLKGVCTTLMSQSMIHHINNGTRCFYLGVRICSMMAISRQLL
jgi:hypothetical protein